MPLLERARSRLRVGSTLLGDWWSGVWFFLRHRLPVEVRVRVFSVLPEMWDSVRRARKSRVVATAASASAAVASSTTSAYARVIEVTPEPVKAGYRAATKTEGSRAAAARTTVFFLAVVFSLAALVLGIVIVRDVWVVIGSAFVLALSSIILFTQEDTETLLTHSSTVEHIASVFSLGEGMDSIVSVQTTSLGGEVRGYTLMREDLTIIDSPQSWAHVRRAVVRCVSRNVFGWVMSVEDVEHVEIAAYTPLSDRENVPDSR